ncbi:hypothetical protein [Bradyrhizobium sp. LA7.1]|uniref:hypothetical protein n=1 Tax=Bradyrhizobium sp. LA7.1 TaxID=3156324 RepID=UPI0033939756
MFGPYAADPRKANRLHAARRAAGFKSAKAATLAHGWSEATYRAHETATGYIDRSWEQVYATAFRVNLEWLRAGQGEGPPVDPVREARFRARVVSEGGQAKKAAHEAGQRLRLARRVAGFYSVAAAAEALKLKRSTLSAHEVGQNVISTDAARLYGAAFGCSADWLLTGKRPSGLPAPAEARLDALLSLHSHLERSVKEVFLELRQEFRETPLDEPLPYPRTRSKREALLETIPEMSPVELFKAKAKGRAPRGLPGREFGFPPGFLGESLGCAAASAAMVTTPPDSHGRGARILIDRSAAQNAVDHFLLVRADGRTMVVRGNDARIPKPQERSQWVLVGRVCTVIERL